MVDGSGHDLMAEQPDAVLDALISFCSDSNPTLRGLTE